MNPAIILGGLALVSVALASSSKGATAAPSGGSTMPLDVGIPPALDQRIKALLSNSRNPTELDQLAVSCEMAGYNNSAAALQARAAQLRGQITIPGVPVPHGTTPGGYTVPGQGNVPGSPVPSMDPGMSPQLYAQLQQAMQSNNPDLLEKLAVSYEMSGFKQAAASCRARAALLRASMGQISPPIRPTGPTPTGPTPVAPQPPPATPIEDLDPNIPAPLAQAVAAILAKPDLNNDELQTTDALANQCEQNGYPRAAAKLRAKTMAIRAMHAGSALLQTIDNLLTTPAGQLPPIPTTPPQGVPGTQPIPVAPPTPVSPVSPVTPVAPLARVYKVLPGDSPWSIAQRYTGNGANLKQLAAANPDKSARILDGKLYANETLTLPDSWPGTPVAPPKIPAVVPVAPVAPVAPVVPASYTPPASTGDPLIMRGSQGPAVRKAQTMLRIPVDGDFGPGTEAAVKQFQAAHSLQKVDGKIGPETWGALYAASAQPVAPVIPLTPTAADDGGDAMFAKAPGTSPNTVYADPTQDWSKKPILRLGSRGDDVRLWQGIVSTPVDGYYGPNTKAKTVSWQKAHGLAADGDVGPNTWRAAQIAQSLKSGLASGGADISPELAGIMSIIG